MSDHTNHFKAYLEIITRMLNWDKLIKDDEKDIDKEEDPV